RPPAGQRLRRPRREGPDPRQGPAGAGHPAAPLGQGRDFLPGRRADARLALLEHVHQPGFTDAVDAPQLLHPGEVPPFDDGERPGRPDVDYALQFFEVGGIEVNAIFGVVGHEEGCCAAGPLGNDRITVVAVDAYGDAALFVGTHYVGVRIQLEGRPVWMSVHVVFPEADDDHARGHGRQAFGDVAVAAAVVAGQEYVHTREQVFVVPEPPFPFSAFRVARQHRAERAVVDAEADAVVVLAVGGDSGWRNDRECHAVKRQGAQYRFK